MTDYSVRVYPTIAPPGCISGFHFIVFYTFLGRLYGLLSQSLQQLLQLHYSKQVVGDWWLVAEFLVYQTIGKREDKTNGDFG